MVDLEEFVKLDALYEILMPSSSHNRRNINIKSIIFDLEMVADKGVVFVANSH